VSEKRTAKRVTTEAVSVTPDDDVVLSFANRDGVTALALTIDEATFLAMAILQRVSKDPDDPMVFRADDPRVFSADGGLVVVRLTLEGAHLAFGLDAPSASMLEAALGRTLAAIGSPRHQPPRSH